ncbi:MAG TPA: hypothetical protein VN715_22605, partial [Roseiarcus sp.]|nr:hypothetical protein [Roseiarcus sp.]
MKKLASFVAALSLPLMAALPASAGIGVGSAGVGVVPDSNALVEHVQFVYGGRTYCWYDGGWKGPGWYYCGYAWRSGLGWGGGYGWRNWAWNGNSRYWHGGRYYHGGWGGYHGGGWHGGGWHGGGYGGSH